MRCTLIPGGGFVCGGRSRAQHCQTPRCGKTATRLCDFVIDQRDDKPKTCNRRICDRCRIELPDGLDHCPPHAAGEPVEGEHRIHIQTGFDLYAVAVYEHEGSKLVTFSRTPPKRGQRCGGMLQTVPLDKWKEKTKAP
jgi:hypothetical protein